MPAKPWVPVGIMLLVASAVAALAFLDETREAASALADYAGEQAAVAQSLAAGLRARGSFGPDPGSSAEGELRAALRAIAVPSQRLALFRAPGSSTFSTADGRAVSLANLELAVLDGGSVARLERSEAAELGLPARTAMAGIANLSDDPLTGWSVAVVSSASRERDREKRARWRLVVAVAVAAALVSGLGSWALRRQSKALELSRKLAIAEVERERDERLGRLNKAAVMMTFASGLSHELATPLAVISGRAEQLHDRLLTDPKGLSSLATIGQQVEHMQHVIKGFLDLARGGSMNQEQVGAESIVESSRTLVEHRFTKADVALELYRHGQPPSLRCSPILLEHALVNLLLNACDACVAGGTVRLEIVADLEEVGFVVTDDGVGIPQEIVARVAEPFFTTKPRGVGTGLGLAIANEIAKAHHGSLSIAKVEPHGTRAALSIPLA